MKEKNMNGIIVFLVLIIGILLGVIGMITIQKYDGKEEKQQTKIEEKEERKEEIKEDEKEVINSVENDPEEIEEEIHSGCGICSVSGDACCGAGPEVTYDILRINIEKQDLEGINTNNFSIEPFELRNDNYKYEVKYTKKGNDEKVIVDNKTLYNEPYTVEAVFLLDNGMVGIQYYDKTDQALLRKRDYFDTKLNKIETIEGIKSEVYLLSKKYEYTIMGNDCINNEYHELKIYKAEIGNNSVSKSLVRTEKEDGCAGMS